MLKSPSTSLFKNKPSSEKKIPPRKWQHNAKFSLLCNELWRCRQAEMILLLPDPDNAGEGKSRTRLGGLPPKLLQCKFS